MFLAGKKGQSSKKPDQPRQVPQPRSGTETLPSPSQFELDTDDDDQFTVYENNPLSLTQTASDINRFDQTRKHAQYLNIPDNTLTRSNGELSIGSEPEYYGVDSPSLRRTSSAQLPSSPSVSQISRMPQQQGDLSSPQGLYDHPKRAQGSSNLFKNSVLTEFRRGGPSGTNSIASTPTPGSSYVPSSNVSYNNNNNNNVGSYSANTNLPKMYQQDNGPTSSTSPVPSRPGGSKLAQLLGDNPNQGPSAEEQQQSKVKSLFTRSSHMHQQTTQSGYPSSVSTPSVVPSTDIASLGASDDTSGTNISSSGTTPARPQLPPKHNTLRRPVPTKGDTSKVEALLGGEVVNHHISAQQATAASDKAHKLLGKGKGGHGGSDGSSTDHSSLRSGAQQSTDPLPLVTGSLLGEVHNNMSPEDMSEVNIRTRQCSNCSIFIINHGMWLISRHIQRTVAPRCIDCGYYETDVNAIKSGQYISNDYHYFSDQGRSYVQSRSNNVQTVSGNKDFVVNTTLCPACLGVTASSQANSMHHNHFIVNYPVLPIPQVRYVPSALLSPSPTPMTAIHTLYHIANSLRPVYISNMLTRSLRPLQTIAPTASLKFPARLEYVDGSSVLSLVSQALATCGPYLPLLGRMVAPADRRLDQTQCIYREDCPRLAYTLNTSLSTVATSSNNNNTSASSSTTSPGHKQPPTNTTTNKSSSLPSNVSSELCSCMLYTGSYCLRTSTSGSLRHKAGYHTDSQSRIRWLSYKDTMHLITALFHSLFTPQGQPHPDRIYQRNHNNNMSYNNDTDDDSEQDNDDDEEELRQKARSHSFSSTFTMPRYLSLSNNTICTIFSPNTLHSTLIDLLCTTSGIVSGHIHYTQHSSLICGLQYHPDMASYTDNPTAQRLAQKQLTQALGTRYGWYPSEYRGVHPSSNDPNAVFYIPCLPLSIQPMTLHQRISMSLSPSFLAFISSINALRSGLVATTVAVAATLIAMVRSHTYKQLLEASNGNTPSSNTTNTNNNNSSSASSAVQTAIQTARYDIDILNSVETPYLRCVILLHELPFYCMVSGIHFVSVGSLVQNGFESVNFHLMDSDHHSLHYSDHIKTLISFADLVDKNRQTLQADLSRSMASISYTSSTAAATTTTGSQLSSFAEDGPSTPHMTPNPPSHVQSPSSTDQPTLHNLPYSRTLEIEKEINKAFHDNLYRTPLPSAINSQSTPFLYPPFPGDNDVAPPTQNPQNDMLLTSDILRQSTPRSSRTSSFGSFSSIPTRDYSYTILNTVPPPPVNDGYKDLIFGFAMTGGTTGNSPLLSMLAQRPPDTDDDSNSPNPESTTTATAHSIPTLPDPPRFVILGQQSFANALFASTPPISTSLHPIEILHEPISHFNGKSLLYNTILQHGRLCVYSHIHDDDTDTVIDNHLRNIAGTMGSQQHAAQATMSSWATTMSLIRQQKANFFWLVSQLQPTNINAVPSLWSTMLTLYGTIYKSIQHKLLELLTINEPTTALVASPPLSLLSYISTTKTIAYMRFRLGFRLRSIVVGSAKVEKSLLSFLSTIARGISSSYSPSSHTSSSHLPNMSSPISDDPIQILIKASQQNTGTNISQDLRTSYSILHSSHSNEPEYNSELRYVGGHGGLSSSAYNMNEHSLNDRISHNYNNNNESSMTKPATIIASQSMVGTYSNNNNNDNNNTSSLASDTFLTFTLQGQVPILLQDAAFVEYIGINGGWKLFTFINVSDSSKDSLIANNLTNAGFFYPPMLPNIKYRIDKARKLSLLRDDTVNQYNYMTTTPVSTAAQSELSPAYTMVSSSPCMSPIHKDDVSFEANIAYSSLGSKIGTTYYPIPQLLVSYSIANLPLSSRLYPIPHYETYGSTETGMVSVNSTPVISSSNMDLSGNTINQASVKMILRTVYIHKPTGILLYHNIDSEGRMVGSSHSIKMLSAYDIYPLHSAQSITNDPPVHDLSLSSSPAYHTSTSSLSSSLLSDGGDCYGNNNDEQITTTQTTSSVSISRGEIVIKSIGHALGYLPTDQQLIEHRKMLQFKATLNSDVLRYCSPHTPFLPGDWYCSQDLGECRVTTTNVTKIQKNKRTMGVTTLGSAVENASSFQTPTQLTNTTMTHTPISIIGRLGRVRKSRSGEYIDWAMLESDVNTSLIQARPATSLLQLTAPPQSPGGGRTSPTGAHMRAHATPPASPIARSARDNVFRNNPNGIGSGNSNDNNLHGLSGPTTKGGGGGARMIDSVTFLLPGLDLKLGNSLSPQDDVPVSSSSSPVHSPVKPATTTTASRLFVDPQLQSQQQHQQDKSDNNTPNCVAILVIPPHALSVLLSDSDYQSISKSSKFTITQESVYSYYKRYITQIITSMGMTIHAIPDILIITHKPFSFENRVISTTGKMNRSNLVDRFYNDIKIAYEQWSMSLDMPHHLSPTTSSRMSGVADPFDSPSSSGERSRTGSVVSPLGIRSHSCLSCIMSPTFDLHLLLSVANSIWSELGMTSLEDLIDNVDYYITTLTSQDILSLLDDITTLSSPSMGNNNSTSSSPRSSATSSSLGFNFGKLPQISVDVYNGTSDQVSSQSSPSSPSSFLRSKTPSLMAITAQQSISNVQVLRTLKQLLLRNHTRLNTPIGILGADSFTIHRLGTYFQNTYHHHFGQYLGELSILDVVDQINNSLSLHTQLRSRHGHGHGNSGMAPSSDVSIIPQLALPHTCDSYTPTSLHRIISMAKLAGTVDVPSRPGRSSTLSARPSISLAPQSNSSSPNSNVASPLLSTTGSDTSQTPSTPSIPPRRPTISHHMSPQSLGSLPDGLVPPVRQSPPPPQHSILPLSSLITPPRLSTILSKFSHEFSILSRSRNYDLQTILDKLFTKDAHLTSSSGSTSTSMGSMSSSGVATPSHSITYQQQQGSINHVSLVTGATGLVGMYLLRQLIFQAEQARLSGVVKRVIATVRIDPHDITAFTKYRTEQQSLRTTRNAKPFCRQDAHKTHDESTCFFFKSAVAAYKLRQRLIETNILIPEPCIQGGSVSPTCLLHLHSYYSDHSLSLLRSEQRSQNNNQASQTLQCYPHICQCLFDALLVIPIDISQPWWGLPITPLPLTTTTTTTTSGPVFSSGASSPALPPPQRPGSSESANSSNSSTSLPPRRPLPPPPTSQQSMHTPETLIPALAADINTLFECSISQLLGSSIHQPHATLYHHAPSFLALSIMLSQIYSSAAVVNHTASFTSLYASNVLGPLTISILAKIGGEFRRLFHLIKNGTNISDKDRTILDPSLSSGHITSFFNPTSSIFARLINPYLVPRVYHISSTDTIDERSHNASPFTLDQIFSIRNTNTTSTSNITIPSRDLAVMTTLEHNKTEAHINICKLNDITACLDSKQSPPSSSSSSSSSSTSLSTKALPQSSFIHSGYRQTKWVGERLIVGTSRLWKIPLLVFNCGHITLPWGSGNDIMYNPHTLSQLSTDDVADNSLVSHYEMIASASSSEQERMINQDAAGLNRTTYQASINDDNISISSSTSSTISSSSYTTKSSSGNRGRDIYQHLKSLGNNTIKSMSISSQSNKQSSRHQLSITDDLLPSNTLPVSRPAVVDARYIASLYTSSSSSSNDNKISTITDTLHAQHVIPGSTVIGADITQHLSNPVASLFPKDFPHSLLATIGLHSVAPPLTSVTSRKMADQPPARHTSGRLKCDIKLNLYPVDWLVLAIVKSAAHHEEIRTIYQHYQSGHLSVYNHSKHSTNNTLTHDDSSTGYEPSYTHNTHSRSSHTHTLAIDPSLSNRPGSGLSYHPQHHSLNSGHILSSLDGSVTLPNIASLTECLIFPSQNQSLINISSPSPSSPLQASPSSTSVTENNILSYEDSLWYDYHTPLSVDTLNHIYTSKQKQYNALHSSSSSNAATTTGSTSPRNQHGNNTIHRSSNIVELFHNITQHAVKSLRTQVVPSPRSSTTASGKLHSLFQQGNDPEYVNDISSWSNNGMRIILSHYQPLSVLQLVARSLRLGYHYTENAIEYPLLSHQDSGVLNARSPEKSSTTLRVDTSKLTTAVILPTPIFPQQQLSIMQSVQSIPIPLPDLSHHASLTHTPAASTSSLASQYNSNQASSSYNNDGNNHNAANNNLNGISSSILNNNNNTSHGGTGGLGGGGNISSSSSTHTAASVALFASRLNKFNSSLNSSGNTNTTSGGDDNNGTSDDNGSQQGSLAATLEIGRFLPSQANKVHISNTLSSNVPYWANVAFTRVPHPFRISISSSYSHWLLQLSAPVFYYAYNLTERRYTQHTIPSPLVSYYISFLSRHTAIGNDLVWVSASSHLLLYHLGVSCVNGNEKAILQNYFTRIVQQYILEYFNHQQQTLQRRAEKKRALLMPSSCSINNVLSPSISNVSNISTLSSSNSANSTHQFASASSSSLSALPQPFTPQQQPSRPVPPLSPPLSQPISTPQGSLSPSLSTSSISTNAPPLPPPPARPVRRPLPPPPQNPQ